MGKHGPCYHCGVTSTPLWRNGPPEKPILCNACGSRWRTKGTLTNYVPLHARQEHDEIEPGFPIPRTVFNKSKEPKLLKRKFTNDIGDFGIPHLESSHGVQRVFDEDTSNRSSSGSAISNNESSVQYGGVADVSELTGPSQAPTVWDSTVPSRKRTCFVRPKQSPFEKLTKDLYTIWHQQQSACLSGSSEEELLLESDKPMVSVEIGHGSVLIRHPNSITREEESEASSLSFENKLLNSGRLTSVSDFTDDSLANRSRSKGNQQFNKSADQGAIVRSSWGGDQLERIQILSSHGSPLCLIELQDILNYEEFLGKLTNDEQQKLLKLLPAVDIGTPDSLKMMFGSDHFRENIFSFQKLLGDGIFDGSTVVTEDFKHLETLILSDQRKSKWIEAYMQLKDSKGKGNLESEIVADLEAVGQMSTSKLWDVQHKKLQGSNIMTEGVKLLDKDVSLCAKSLFAFPADDMSSISDFNMDSYDQDLLVDVPSNNIYPESELLIPTSGTGNSFQARFLRPR